MSQLKELLGELYTPEIEAKIGTKVIYVWNKEDEKEKDREPIPKHRVNEMLETSKVKITDLEGQIKSLETTLETKEKDLKDLKKKAEGNDELVKQIDELQKNFKAEKEAREVDKQTLAQKELALKKELSLSELLMNEGVTDANIRKLLAKGFDIEKLTTDENGKIKKEDFDVQVKPMKENPALINAFGKEVLAGNEHQESEVRDDSKFYTREQVQKMTPEQVKEKIDVINESMSKW